MRDIQIMFMEAQELLDLTLLLKLNHTVSRLAYSQKDIFLGEATLTKLFYLP